MGSAAAERYPLGSVTANIAMPRLATILEARVPSGREADLQMAYRAAGQDPFPPGLVGSALLHATDDSTLWRIETFWESRESLEAMRGRGTPRGVLIFRAAGVEPTLTVFDVADQLTPSSDAA